MTNADPAVLDFDCGFNLQVTFRVRGTGRIVAIRSGFHPSIVSADYAPTLLAMVGTCHLESSYSGSKQVSAITDYPTPEEVAAAERYIGHPLAVARMNPARGWAVEYRGAPPEAPVCYGGSVYDPRWIRKCLADGYGFNGVDLSTLPVATATAKAA